MHLKAVLHWGSMLLPICATCVILLGSFHPADGVPREILNSGKKPKSMQHETTVMTKPTVSPDSEQFKVFIDLLEDWLGANRNKIDSSSVTNIFSSITSSISSIGTLFTSMITSILSGLTSSLSGLVDSIAGAGTSSIMFPSKPSNLTSALGGGTGCNLIDPHLAMYTPGIFFVTPIVIIGIVIFFKIIAIIAVAIASAISPHFNELIDDIHNNKDKGHDDSGYAPSSEYGPPSSSYGTPSHQYSRLAQNVDEVSQNFAQAYDKYSALQQPQLPDQQAMGNYDYFKQDPYYEQKSQWSSTQRRN